MIITGNIKITTGNILYSREHNNMANVLITVADSTTSLSIIKGLRQYKKNEIEITSFEIDEVFY